MLCSIGWVLFLEIRVLSKLNQTHSTTHNMIWQTTVFPKLWIMNTKFIIRHIRMSRKVIITHNNNVTDLNSGLHSTNQMQIWTIKWKYQKTCHTHTSSLREEIWASHSLHEKLVLVLDGVFLLRIGENRPEPLLFVIVYPADQGHKRKFTTNPIQFSILWWDWWRLKKDEPENEPGVEIGGEVDEGLEAEFLKQVCLVDGERVGRVDAAPLGGLGLQALHSFAHWLAAESACLFEEVWIWRFVRKLFGLYRGLVPPAWIARCWIWFADQWEVEGLETMGNGGFDTLDPFCLFYSLCDTMS